MICVQGGAEFGPQCEQMDAELVRLAGGGLVVVTAVAGAVGREHDTANRHGVEHFEALGAEAVAAPDVRLDEAGACAAVREADLVVLPGGSPARLLDVLTTTSLGVALRDLLDRGGVLMGASAGAMVLGEHCWLPDRGGTVAPGLGWLPGVLVVPHWTAERQELADRLASGIPGDAVVLGLPEQSGLVVSTPSAERQVPGMSLVAGGRWFLAEGSRPAVVPGRGATART